MTSHRAAITALAILPALAAAQATERASFYLIAGKDTIIAERMTRGAATMQGEFVDRARGGRMVYTATLAPGDLISQLETRSFRIPADTIGDRARFVIGGDSISARMGDAPAAHLPSVPGALPIINPSVAFLEQVVIKAK